MVAVIGLPIGAYGSYEWCLIPYCSVRDAFSDAYIRSGASIGYGLR